MAGREREGQRRGIMIYQCGWMANEGKWRIPVLVHNGKIICPVTEMGSITWKYIDNKLVITRKG